MAGFLRGKKAIVTGANGFIGAWLCKKLVEEGAAVIALIHHETELLRLHGIENKVEAMQADIKDFASLQEIFEKYKPELCFHLAAISSTKDGMKDLSETFQTNVMATLNVLEAARQNNAAVCFVSTVKVYGGVTKKGFAEKDVLFGKSAYATSKICGEVLCRMYASNFGLNVAIARPGNVYGGGDLKFERLIPGAVRAVLEGRNPRVNGKGKSSFDFIFVGDAAEGLAALGGKLLNKRLYAEAFNFGSGTTTSVRTVVEKIVKLSGGKVKIDFMGRETLAKEKLLIGKANKRLHWHPKYKMDKALKETIEWYRNYFKA